MFQRIPTVPGLLTICLLASIACSLSGLFGINDPGSPYQMGLVAIEAGDFEMAYQYFDDSIAENPKHAESYYYRAFSLHQIWLVQATVPDPPTKPPGPEIPDPPPEPEDQSDSEAVAAYLEQLVEYQNEVAALQIEAGDDFSVYEDAIAEYQAMAVTLNQEQNNASAQIAIDILTALELGLPPDLEQLARELLGS